MSLIAGYRLQRRGYLQVKKAFSFMTPFNSQHVTGSKTLLKSAQKHFDLFFISLRETELENVFISHM